MLLQLVAFSLPDHLSSSTRNCGMQVISSHCEVYCIHAAGLRRPEQTNVRCKGRSELLGPAAAGCQAVEFEVVYLDSILLR